MSSEQATYAVRTTLPEVLAMSANNGILHSGLTFEQAEHYAACWGNKYVEIVEKQR